MAKDRAAVYGYYYKKQVQHLNESLNGAKNVLKRRQSVLANYQSGQYTSRAALFFVENDAKNDDLACYVQVHDYLFA